MKRSAAIKEMQKAKDEVTDILEGLGVDLDLGENPGVVFARHRELYLWRVMACLAKAIEAASQKTIIVEELEAIDGVGNATAKRIVEALSS